MGVRRSTNSFAEQLKRLPHKALYRRAERLRPSDRARLDAEIRRIAGDGECLSHAGNRRDGIDMYVIRFSTADQATEMQAWLDASDISNWPAPQPRTDIPQLKVGGR
ncbi:hypothetical protein [Reyranella massiliensis]|uniref:hypothetical protein n=1 Tax=Reyranella massiliensis TaxID=445220 RepID=UPI0002E5C146|nr:hypothetical protein [Reyranella massiliensis]